MILAPHSASAPLSPVRYIMDRVSVATSVRALVEDFTFISAVGFTGNVWQHETVNCSLSSVALVNIKFRALATPGQGGQYIGLDSADPETIA